MIDESLRQALGLILVVVGSVLTVTWMFRLFDTGRLRYLLVPPLLIALGLGLIAWEVIAVGALMLGIMALCLYVSHLQDKAYERDYPVFATKPIRTLTSRAGFEHRLHIAEVRSIFIIGIDYDAENDGNPVVYKTDWKDEFPDFSAAERELLKRLADFIPAGDVPAKLSFVESRNNQGIHGR